MWSVQLAVVIDGSQFMQGRVSDLQLPVKSQFAELQCTLNASQGQCETYVYLFVCMSTHAETFQQSYTVMFYVVFAITTCYRCMCPPWHFLQADEQLVWGSDGCQSNNVEWLLGTSRKALQAQPHWNLQGQLARFTKFGDMSLSRYPEFNHKFTQSLSPCKCNVITPQFPNSFCWKWFLPKGRFQGYTFQFSLLSGRDTTINTVDWALVKKPTFTSSNPRSGLPLVGIGNPMSNPIRC